MIRRPPRSPHFPYTTLFRSHRRTLSRVARTRRAASLIGCPSATSSTASIRRYSRASWATDNARSRRRRSVVRSEEHTSELQSRQYLVCRLLLEKKKQIH